MNTTVNLNLDPVAFYQQKMLLVELTDKFFDTYHNGDLDNMLQGIIAIFDEIGDQAEFQGEFEYPQETDDGEHFKDEQYNNVFSKLFNHKPLDEPLFTTSSQIVDATFTSNWDDGSYFDAPAKSIFSHTVYSISAVQAAPARMPSSKMKQSPLMAGPIHASMPMTSLIGTTKKKLPSSPMMPIGTAIRTRSMDALVKRRTNHDSLYIQRFQTARQRSAQ